MDVAGDPKFRIPVSESEVVRHQLRAIPVKPFIPVALTIPVRRGQESGPLAVVRTRPREFVQASHA